MMSVLLLVTLYTLCFIQFTSGYKCYQCGGNAPKYTDVSEGTCSPDKSTWNQTDCIAAEGNCATWDVKITLNGVNVSRIIRGCSEFFSLSCATKKGITSYYFERECRCGYDLCNDVDCGDCFGPEPPRLHCHLCGGDSEACPEDLNEAKLVECINTFARPNRDGICHSIQNLATGKITLGCTYKKTDDKKGCKEEKGIKTCYCDSDGCNNHVDADAIIPNKTEESEKSPTSVGSLPSLQLGLIPLIIDFTVLGY